MSEITVCVGNYGYYAEGYLHDAWIDLPKKQSEIQAFLVDHRLYDRYHEETYISDYDGIPFGFSYGNLFSEYTPLESLNLLAAIMQLYPHETETVTAALSCGSDTPETICGLINWILQADDIPYYSYDVPAYFENSTPAEKLGYTYAQYTPWWQALVEAGQEDYFDLERYGESCSQSVHLGDNGYLDACQEMPPEDTYDMDEIREMCKALVA